MKKNVLLVVCMLLNFSTMGAYANLSCDTFRVSDDSNSNIQNFSFDGNESVNINGVKLDINAWDSGSLAYMSMGYATKATFKSKDGKGDYRITVTPLSIISEVSGYLAIGRSHDITLFKVRAQVSRNGKIHEFNGTCKDENITTCGGACADESEDRDLI